MSPKALTCALRRGASSRRGHESTIEQPSVRQYNVRLRKKYLLICKTLTLKRFSNALF